MKTIQLNVLYQENSIQIRYTKKRFKTYAQQLCVTKVVSCGALTKVMHDSCCPRRHGGPAAAQRLSRCYGKVTAGRTMKVKGSYY